MGVIIDDQELVLLAMSIPTLLCNFIVYYKFSHVGKVFVKRIRMALFDGSTTQHTVWSPLRHQTTTPVHHHHPTRSRNTDTRLSTLLVQLEVKAQQTKRKYHRKMITSMTGWIGFKKSMKL